MSTAATSSLKILQQQFGIFPTADAKNLSEMISEFADLSREREMKINGLAASLLENSYRSDDDETGSVIFTHNGERFECVSIAENIDGTDEYDDLSGMFWGFGAVRCYVKRLGYRNRHAPYIIKDTYPAALCWRNYATKLLEMIDDKRFCVLCGQLNPDYTGVSKACCDSLKIPQENNFVCKACALAEMKTPCVTCKSKMGRADNNLEERLEHPTCKRRRLNPGV